VKKILKSIICIMIILLTIVSFIAKSDTLGVFLGTDVYNFQQVVSDRTGIGLNVYGTCMGEFYDADFVKGIGYIVYPNRFGNVVVVKYTGGLKNSISQDLYKKFGQIAYSIRTIPNTGIATHFDFINVKNGSTTIDQLVERAGMPHYVGEAYSTYDLCQWETLDGYIYTINIDPKTGVVKDISISLPDQLRFLEEEEAQLQWQVRLFYLGLAAVLSVILVCLLVIPKKIEKRKAQSKGENCNA